MQGTSASYVLRRRGLASLLAPASPLAANSVCRAGSQITMDTPGSRRAALLCRTAAAGDMPPAEYINQDREIERVQKFQRQKKGSAQG